MTVIVTWPNGTTRTYPVAAYALIPVEALEGTRVRIVRWWS
jgi:hypothetical protein